MEKYKLHTGKSYLIYMGIEWEVIVLYKLYNSKCGNDQNENVIYNKKWIKFTTIKQQCNPKLWFLC